MTDTAADAVRPATTVQALGAARPPRRPALRLGLPVRRRLVERAPTRSPSCSPPRRRRWWGGATGTRGRPSSRASGAASRCRWGPSSSCSWSAPLIGTWILAGIVPTMIYYGLLVLSPSVFYATACVICASSRWPPAARGPPPAPSASRSVGIATAQGLNLGLAAGAVISGAYFGDKMSALSDTTNLAPAVAGTDLFTHIRHMVWTTGPSIAAALVLFAAAGFVAPAPATTAELQIVLDALEGQYSLGLHLLIPVALVLVLVVRRVPRIAIDARRGPGRRGLRGALPGRHGGGVRGRARPAAPPRRGQGLAGSPSSTGSPSTRGTPPSTTSSGRGGMSSMLGRGLARHVGDDVRGGHGVDGPARGAGAAHPARRAQRGKPDLGDAAHRVRHQRGHLGSVHLHRAPGADVPGRVRAARARPLQPLADPGGRRHHHLRAHPLEPRAAPTWPAPSGSPP